MTGTNPLRSSPALPELVPCPLCGPARVRPWIRQGRWQVVRCRGCGLRLTWPRPKPAELEALYASDAYYRERDMGDAAAGAAWDQRAEGILARLPAPVASALDFGAGYGHLTQALRGRGLVAEGCEPSPAARAAARERYGLVLWEDLPERAERRFDLVTLIHSLEHVPDPLLVLRRLHPLLGPGGIAYLEVPHAGGPGMWSAQRRRLILDLPFHLYHFLPETLGTLVERAGFRVAQVGLANPAFVERQLSRRARRQAPSSPPSPGPERTSDLPRPASGLRRTWGGAILPALRRLLPGDHFHLIAVRQA